MEDRAIHSYLKALVKASEPPGTTPMLKRAVDVLFQYQPGAPVRTTDIPELRPAKMADFPEPTWKEVHARQQAEKRRMDKLVGRSVLDKAGNKHDVRVAEPQIEVKQRERLKSLVETWQEGVPETGFDEGQRRLSTEEKKEWRRMAKKLKSIAVNEEVKTAGSWVGNRFFPEGFW